MKNRSGFSCEEADLYLGDGVYAKMDDSYSQVWLMLQSGEAIALDYPMVSKLMQFMDSVPS